MSSSSAKVPIQFVADFELVAEHYQLREHGEYEQAKQAARDNLDNAITCYGAIAASLRMDGLAAGINERIQARIAAEKQEAA